MNKKQGQVEELGSTQKFWWHGTESVGQRRWWPYAPSDTMKTDNDDDDDDDITFVLNINK